MYGWLGYKVGAPLAKSWKHNKHLQKDIEREFDGISDTRKQLLIDWTSDTWHAMDRLSEQCIEKLNSNPSDQAEGWLVPLLQKTYMKSIDFTELFVLNDALQVVASTNEQHRNSSYAHNSILEQGIDYLRRAKWESPLLFGPYVDPITITIGARSSSFHDAVTLLFMKPIIYNGELNAILCGRVPNDVIGDLIQREAGHVYPDSGDNYLFMAKPNLLTHIEPGIALSRSRFEDKTFTMGENLKDGVTTDWGTVTVKEHTELELKFISPATKELHPGVANTIKNGNNLYVQFPAYPDYRYIPVIGKGCTFQLPYCPDIWGMMCEGDFEEVYRVRSIGTKRRQLEAISVAVIAACSIVIVGLLGNVMSPWITGIIVGALQLIAGWFVLRTVQSRTDQQEISQIRRVKKFIQKNAEGKGDLTKRLDLSHFNNNEIKDIAKWLNNMMDSLEGIMLRVRTAAYQVSESQLAMNETATVTTSSTRKVSHQVTEMIDSIHLQLADIEQVREMADTMKETLKVIEGQAASQISVAQSEIDRIGDKMFEISSKVKDTNHSIHSFVDTVQDIRNVIGVIEEISAQTQLLALNASIEAAHVGEQGAGFAVVAGEIRKLANNTKKSTAEVHAITDRIYKEAQKAYHTIDEGNGVVEEGNVLVQTVAEALSEANMQDIRKSEVVDGVVGLLEQIAQVSNKNRKVSTSVGKRVNTLADEMLGVQDTSKQVDIITNQLQQLVGQFKLTEERLR
ncbi:MAG: methyl-accepting chemotaxis protein [Candidatus Pristimantibacillus lignocellulolyticus]|uniref:Methyl-accepting chemotaxis protein n=1 Tax=Candidatus Pristimantibacillus lignocellulolyticus TaxID=2994561 RepID=A0A9J6ZGQ0_9BACL|nr:MAG: methyl-accepting chemotaxis protein [Candidatus Pristimantibacillus lignocellulolyticus]